MFSLPANLPVQLHRPAGPTRRGGPTLLKDVLEEVLADRAVPRPAPAGPGGDPPPELPRAA